MLRDERKLQVTKNHIGRGQVKFCRDGFEQCVDVPADVDTIYMILDKEVTDDSFPISAPKRCHAAFSDLLGEPKSTLGRIRGNVVYYHVSLYLAQAYTDGFRAVHFEFD